jgi:sec-independent protein translocase protein TatB
MFELDWGKLVVIGIVALIVIGPKELPAVLRMVGQWMGKMRRMAAEFQGQFQEAMREAEMAELKGHIDSINQAASELNQIGTFDPIATARKEMESAIDQAPASSDPSSAEPGSSAGADTAAGAAALSGGTATGASAPLVDVPVVPPEPVQPIPDRVEVAAPTGEPSKTEAGGGGSA